MSDKSKKILLDYDVAVNYGTDAAIFIAHLKGWIEYNKRQGVNYREGRTWMYNTVCRKKYNNAIEGAAGDQKVKSLEESLPFWTANQIRYIVEKLVEQKVIITTDKFNKFKNDRKLWYAFVNEEDWFDVSTRLESTDEIEDGLGNFRIQEEEELFPIQKEAKNEELEIPTRKIPSPNEVSTRKIPSEARKIPNSELGNFPAHKKGFNNNSNEEEEEESNDRDILPTNFNDPEDLDKKVRRLFRLFVSEAVPHFQNVDNVKKELIDIRPMLTRDVVWEIINEAFKKYPGLPKAQQSVNYLLGIVRGMKNDYVEQWNDARKKEELKEAAINRNTEMKREVDALQKENEKLALKASQLLAENKKLFSASEFNKLFGYIKQGRAQYALGTIEAMLEEKGVKVEG